MLAGCARGSADVWLRGAAYERPWCAVERVVNAALEEALGEAEALLINKLGTVSLAELARSFDVLCKEGEEQFDGY